MSIAPVCANCLSELSDFSARVSILAGMPTVNVSDFGRLRLQGFSFFLMGLLISAWVVRRLWNSLRADFPKLPLLTYRKALAAVFLWGLLFVVVLTMISGARELMTPGAWIREGVTYKVASRQTASVRYGEYEDATLNEMRRLKIEGLRIDLWRYHDTHKNEFPADIASSSIPAERWLLPERMASRYVYVAGRKSQGPAQPLLFEPDVYDGPRYVLMTNGEVRTGHVRLERTPRGGGCQVKQLFGWLLVPITVAGVLGCLDATGPAELIIWPLFGWAVILNRAVFEITVDWKSIWTTVGALVLLAVGIHWLVASFYRRIARNDVADSYPPAWRIKWTAALVGALLAMLAGGVSTLGISHQFSWLVMSENSLLDIGSKEALLAQSKSNLKQIGMALQQYYHANDHFPSGGTADSKGRLLHSWETALLPYIGEEQLAARINPGVPWTHPGNASYFRRPLAVFTHPAIVCALRQEGQFDEQGYAVSHYAANGWVLGSNNRMRLQDVRNGATFTLAIGEIRENFKPWGDPTNYRDPALGVNTSPVGFGGPYLNARGAQFLFLDGHTAFISERIDPNVMKQLAIPPKRGSCNF